MKAALPANEKERLQALRRHGILDTPREASFDRITRLVAQLLNVPVVQVTLIDTDRQWYKSCYGFDADSTSRDVSFCAHAILSNTATIVPDVTLDPRFADNPLVTGQPRVRFYAGVPLKSYDGFNLGTLCVADFKPRQFTADAIAILHDFAAIATDQLRLRVSLRESVQQTVAIANLNSGVLVTDPTQPDNPIIFCNPCFTEMTGHTLESVLGQNCRFLQGPDTEPAALEEMRRAIAERREYHGLLLNYRKNGEPFWNELWISPVFDKDGRLINFVGLQNDVTERKRTEDTLKESFDKLKQLEALRDNLTSMIVHDLRSPLTAILMSIRLLKDTGGPMLSTQDSKILEIAHGSTENLIEMVSQLLDVSRLEAGEIPLLMADHDLLDLAHAAAKPLASLVGKRNFNIVAPLPVTARCDGPIVQRIIGNLLGNAIKFTPVDGFIQVDLSRGNSGVRVSVTDNGYGVSAQFHESIFDKFGQVKNGVSVGTGLGLTFCKLAAEAHGGRVGIDSELGKGSTFWFELPHDLADKSVIP